MFLLLTSPNSIGFELFINKTNNNTWPKKKTLLLTTGMNNTSSILDTLKQWFSTF